MDDNIERTKFNIILLGETLVGKTCLINSLTGKEFNENQIATIGVDFVSRNATIDGKNFVFRIYDTGGQERYDSVATSILKTMNGFILVFSVDNKKSLEKISNWVDNIEGNVDRNEKVLILVGNKIDINEREVTKEEGMNFAKERNMKYYETSAKTGDGIKEAFNNIFQYIYELDEKIKENHQKENVNQNDNQRNERIEINKKNHNKKLNKSKCC